MYNLMGSHYVTMYYVACNQLARALVDLRMVIYWPKHVVLSILVLNTLDNKVLCLTVHNICWAIRLLSLCVSEEGWTSVAVEISGFRREVDVTCARLGDYVAYSGNSFLDNPSVPSSRVKKSTFLDFLTLQDGSDRLFRNVVKELLMYAA